MDEILEIPCIYLFSQQKRVYLRRKGKKETEFKDTKSEVDCLFLGVEQCQARLEQWTQKEAEASEIVAAYPAKSVKQKQDSFC